MITHDLKTIVKGSANLDCVKAGGIAVYHLLRKCKLYNCRTQRNHSKRSILLMACCGKRKCKGGGKKKR